ncbi:hypothetical protein [Algisphaera agarilytica]|uniref:Uncharacterized protein n=1 Tax=Algisphaera agarilytica TaxID=1385975 RepID=A0A7X0H6U0_9BACT|nr:hypothetical protein [Algisphaera agarilytica]MBB6428875.1 hypothetical protein [Algisphaera agarilytica]
MAKQDLSRYQQGIVKRYYENHDTIQSNKLSDLVSELWLAEDAKTQTKLWGKAQVALMRMGVDATRVGQVVAKRDMEALAQLVQKADAGKAMGQHRASAPGTVKRPHKGATPLDGSEIKAMGARSVADQPGGGRTIGQMRDEAAAKAGYDSLEEENLKRALKAFRRKLKTIRRDDESKLGSKYVTSGRGSQISAVTPPKEYPMAVWIKLVELGRLKKGGQGTFELP